jgi:hypothetical protein
MRLGGGPAFCIFGKMRKRWQRFLGSAGLIALIAGSVTFAVWPVRLEEISCGTVANPDFSDDLADTCQEALASRWSTSVAIATFGGVGVLGAAVIDPRRVRRPMSPPSPENY